MVKNSVPCSSRLSVFPPMKTIPLPPTPHTPAPYTGPSAAAVLAQRKQFLNPGLFLYYKQPIMIVEGKMQYVWDDTGKRYLDGLGGIVTVSVGHCHPHVLQSARRVMLMACLVAEAMMMRTIRPGIVRRMSTRDLITTSTHPRK